VALEASGLDPCGCAAPQADPHPLDQGDREPAMPPHPLDVLPAGRDRIERRGAWPLHAPICGRASSATMRRITPAPGPARSC